MKQIKNHIQNNKSSYFWIFLALIMGCILFFITNQEVEEYHVHADFKVSLNGETLNFSQSKYQSTGFNTLHPEVHLHDNNGNVIHHHGENINFSTFFDSLNISLSNNCFTIDENSYCTNETHELSFYINNNQVDTLANYVIDDLDQILILYDKKNINITRYLDLVTDEACIQSALCPERGAPSEGSCITGETCIVDINQIN